MFEYTVKKNDEAKTIIKIDPSSNDDLNKSIGDIILREGGYNVL